MQVEPSDHVRPSGTDDGLPNVSIPQGAVKTMAKDLVRTRNYVTKFIEMKSHLQGAALKLEVRG